MTALINHPEVYLNIPFILSLLGILKEFVNPLSHGNVQTIPSVNKRQAQTRSSSDFLMTVSILNPRVSLLLLRDNILADTLTIQVNESLFDFFKFHLLIHYRQISILLSDNWIINRMHASISVA